MAKLPTLSLYLDARRTKDFKTKSPLKLRVYFNKKAVFYSLDVNISQEDFELSYGAKKPRGEYKELKLALESKLAKANDIANKIKPFTFDAFDLRYNGKFKDASDDFIGYYHLKIDQLRKEGREGTADNYLRSLKSITRFALSISRAKEIKSIPFTSITPDWLNKYEKWMLKQGNSISTVGIYLRPLRAIFNMGKSEGAVGEDYMPFGRYKYQIPASKKVKKALDRNDLRQLFEYKPEEGEKYHMVKARDFWFFSYVCNGMNFRDIAELKWGNIQGNKIVFIREKTRNTTRANQKPVIVMMNDFVREMITKYGTSPKVKTEYVFPIIRTLDSDFNKRNKAKNFTRFVNQHMKRLAEKLGITTEISTYWARHSFTTTAVRNGASLEYMQEALGHQNITTTMSYWAGFDDEARIKVSETLLDFT